MTARERYKKSATLKSLERKQKLRGLSVYRQAGVWRVLRYLPGGQILDSSFLSSTAKNKAAAIREALKMKPHRNPRRYRRNVRHGHHRHHSALSKRGLMTKRERRRFTKRMKRHHRVLRLKYREKFGSRRKGSR